MHGRKAYINIPETPGKDNLTIVLRQVTVQSINNQYAALTILVLLYGIPLSIINIYETPGKIRNS